MDGSDIPTEIPDIKLRPVAIGDAEPLWSLMVRNRDRLTDWKFPADLSVEHVVSEYIDHPPYGRTTFGIWEGDRLRGTASLTPAEPPHWAIGYFLDSESTGRGFATAACRALAAVARTEGAADLYGIVTNGNEKSSAVLRRAGYEMIQELATSTRWWLPLRDDPDPPVMA